MSKMGDRALIDSVRDAAIPRIKDIIDFYIRAGEEKVKADIAGGLLPELENVPLVPVDPQLKAEAYTSLWNAPLTTTCVKLMWAIRDLSTDGSFLVDEASIAAACSKIDDAKLKRHTGLRLEHIRPLIEKVGEALIEVVRAHGTIETEIDRQPIVLRASAA